MKKKKSEITHQEIIEELIFDENIQDNMHVSNDYAPDDYGNQTITMGFTSMPNGRKKSTSALIVFSFNEKGRLVGMQVATKKKGERNWHMAISDVFMDFVSKLTGSKDN